MIEWFTEEWAQALRGELSRSETYRSVAKTWKWPVVLVLRKDPAKGRETDRAMYFDLLHGDCRAARVATESDLATAPIVISADAEIWKEVLTRQLEPIGALVRGKLKLTRGRLMTLAPHATSARELVNTATAVTTRFSE